MLEEIIKRSEELEKDYENILSTINRLDQDRSNLVTRGVSIRGALDELQRLRAQFENNEEKCESCECEHSAPVTAETQAE